MRFALILLLLILTACGSLKVQVDVLDPAYVEETVRQPELRRYLELALSQSDDTIRKQLNKQRQVHENLYRKLAVDYERRKAKAPDFLQKVFETAIERLKNPKEVLDPIYTKGFQDISVANQAIRTALDQLEFEQRAEILSGRRRIEGRLAGLIEDRKNRILSFRALIASDIGNKGAKALDDLLQDPNLTATEVAIRTNEIIGNESRAIAEIDSATASLIGRKTLAEDPLAFAVASAPIESWKEEYNRTLARGYLGNFDVAVKLDSHADFTVKGVSFDPNTVAKVAAKVTIQGLLIGAQIAGVPIATPPAEDGDGTAFASASAALATALAKQDARHALLEDYRSALLDLADAITREREVIEATTGTERDQARQRVRKAVEIALQQFRQRFDLSILSND
jgi:hypothetical protein